MQLNRPAKPQILAHKQISLWARAGSMVGRRIVLRRSLTLGFCALASAVLGGCALLRPHADPTRFYVLTVPRFPPERVAEGGFKRWRVGLRPIELPPYLQNKALVVRAGANEIRFADFDRWAEPLDQGIGRVIKEALLSAVNVAGVALNSHGDDTLDFEVALRILACEGARADTGKSSIRFAVRWETRTVATNSTVIHRGGFTADALTWDGKHYGQLAERLSEAVAAAGQTLAAELPLETAPPAKLATGNSRP